MKTGAPRKLPRVRKSLSSLGATRRDASSARARPSRTHHHSKLAVSPASRASDAILNAQRDRTMARQNADLTFPIPGGPWQPTCLSKVQALDSSAVAKPATAARRSVSGQRRLPDTADSISFTVMDETSLG